MKITFCSDHNPPWRVESRGNPNPHPTSASRHASDIFKRPQEIRNDQHRLGPLHAQELTTSVQFRKDSLLRFDIQTLLNQHFWFSSHSSFTKVQHFHQGFTPKILKLSAAGWFQLPKPDDPLSYPQMTHCWLNIGSSLIFTHLHSGLPDRAEGLEAFLQTSKFGGPVKNQEKPNTEMLLAVCLVIVLVTSNFEREANQKTRIVCKKQFAYCCLLLL